MGKEQEKETEQFGQTIKSEPEPEPQTPTPEELLAQAQAQIDALTKERDEGKKGLSTAHSKLTERDRELKKRADIDSRLDGFEETQRILAAMVNERIASGEGLEPSEKTDYLKQFDEITKRQKADRDQMQLKSQQEEYNRQADACYIKAKEVFKDDDDALEKIEDLLSTGRLERAEAKVAKAESTTDTKGEKMESEDARIERLAEEKLRQKMEEKGLLTSDAGGPAGAATNEEKIRENFRNNPNNKAARDAYLDLQRRKRES